MKTTPLFLALAGLTLVTVSWAAWQLQQARDSESAVDSGIDVASSNGEPLTGATKTALGRESLTEGVRFLVALQAADGGWRSEHYGALRGGAATTSLVLYALSHAPAELRSQYEPQLRRGWEFLSSGVAQAGYVANPDGSADYPTYATAMAIVSAERLGWLFPAERRRMIDYLIASQLTEQQGWTESDADYGGWDMAGGATASGQRITPGTNLSVTCFALEALSLDKTAAPNEARQKALHYLAKCQNLPGDGGFVFSPLGEDPGNKAGVEPVENNPRSYGPMTCDGLRSLMLCGESPYSERVRAAAKWLATNDELRAVPGFSTNGSASAWATDLRFYYFASRAKSSSSFPDQRTSLQERLIPILTELQAKDGSWSNTTPTVRMREDDPLIATALAVIAIGALIEPTTSDRP